MRNFISETTICQTKLNMLHYKNSPSLFVTKIHTRNKEVICFKNK